MNENYLKETKSNENTILKGGPELTVDNNTFNDGTDPDSMGFDGKEGVDDDNQ